jgi:hypothetical protein
MILYAGLFLVCCFSVGCGKAQAIERVPGKVWVLCAALDIRQGVAVGGPGLFADAESFEMGSGYTMGTPLIRNPPAHPNRREKCSLYVGFSHLDTQKIKVDAEYENESTGFNCYKEDLLGRSTGEKKVILISDEDGPRFAVLFAVVDPENWGSNFGAGIP